MVLRINCVRIKRSRPVTCIGYCLFVQIEFSTTDIITVSKSEILERPAGYNYTSVKKLNSYLLSQHFRTSDSTQIGEHARTYTPLATPFWKEKKTNRNDYSADFTYQWLKHYHNLIKESISKRCVDNVPLKYLITEVQPIESNVFYPYRHTMS